MARAWKENWDGKGEEVQQHKNQKLQRGGQKKEKSKRRMGSLKRSGLPAEELVFVANAELQPSEHSDPEDKTHCTIVTRKCVLLEVSKFVDALDVEFKSQKSRPGNVVYTWTDRVLTNKKLRMSKGKKAPWWAIRSRWLEENASTLKRASKPFIDSKLKTMPYANQVAQFINDHEPKECVYLSDDPTPVLEDLAPAIEPALPVHVATQPVTAPTVQPVVQPAAQSVAQPAPTHIPYFPSYTQQLAHYGLDQHNQHLEQNVPYGLFSGNTAGYGLPPPNYMLGGHSFHTEPGLESDALHPFTLQDRAVFDNIMAQVNEALANSSQSDPPANDTTIPPSNLSIPEPPNIAPVPNTEIAASVAEPVQRRSSGRCCQAMAKAVTADATEDVTDKDLRKLPGTTVLKLKLKKAGKKVKVSGKEKANGKEKASGEKKASGKGKKSVKGNDQEPAPSLSRKPFDISKIKKIKFLRLSGE
ncbi:hypothetical protein FRC07_002023 [Ceratobasidium sp. 392]|nr:hypothetical protein FRC07_002023 [Ceratobasidium sp. 392]